MHPGRHNAIRDYSLSDTPATVVERDSDATRPRVQRRRVHQLPRHREPSRSARNHSDADGARRRARRDLPRPRDGVRRWNEPGAHRATLPDATFVGFDFAARPIARAQRMASDLGLANIRLTQLDLREVPADLGSFDYIIAHGLYSWIPTEVRAHVMPLIARHLAPNGVAFVSFNTLPGCHMRRAVWEMLRYHTREIADLPAKRRRRAHAARAGVSTRRAVKTRARKRCARRFVTQAKATTHRWLMTT